MISLKRDLKRCVVCNRVFKAISSKQKICSVKCRKIYYELQGKPSEYQKGHIDNIIYKFNPKVKVTHLDRVVAEAKKANKSYGQYVGSQYMAATKDIPMVRKYDTECSFVQYTDGISIYSVKPATQKAGIRVVQEDINGFCTMKKAYGINQSFETLKQAQRALDEYARINHLHEYIDEEVENT